MKNYKVLRMIFVAVFAVVLIVVPQSSFAAESMKKPAASDVKYVKDETGRVTGIDSFTIAPYTYYNLSQDKTINPNGKSTIALNDAELLKIAQAQIFPKWGIIAEGIFRDQASQLVTIEGSGMMTSDKSKSQSFDKHFSYGKRGVSEAYSEYNWSVSDLASELGTATSSKQVGETCWDETRVTGITSISSLADARRLMGQELRNCSDDNDISVDEFLGNNKDKTDNKYRLPDLSDDKSGSGFANVVTCVNRAGSSGDYDYVTFGLAVYDFDISPIAAENLKYIEAASNIEDGEKILMGEKGNVDWSDATGISFSSNNKDGITTYLSNRTPTESTHTAALENSSTEENSITNEETFEWGMEQEIGLELNIGTIDGNSMFPRASFNISNSWHELWATTKSNTQTHSTTKSKSINTEVTLPGHTVAKINQSVNDKNTKEYYQQPVVLSYKVAVYAMSGDYFNGSQGGIEPSRYDKQWMSVIFDGSDQQETSGCYALGSLYNRAVVNRDTQGYDGAKGKYRSWCDKSAWNSSSKINWSSVENELSDGYESRRSHDITSKRTGRKSTIADMARELPLLERASIMNSNQENITSSVDQIVALYPLDSVELVKGSKTYEVAPHERFYLGTVELQGFNRSDVEFYGFDPSWGEWAIYDASDPENGRIIEDQSDDDEDALDHRIKVGSFTLVNDPVLKRQYVEVDNNAGNNDNVYLKWMIKKDAKIVSNENLINDKPCMTEDEKEEVERPVIQLNVRDSNSSVSDIEIDGEYKGLVDEEINLNKVLNARPQDSTGKIRNVAIFWEDRGVAGVDVTDDGTCKFSNPGTYKVRAYCYNDENTRINSPWVEIQAINEPELTKIVMDLPEFDSDELLIDKKHSSLQFDLFDYISYYDQYGEKMDPYTYDSESGEWMSIVPDIQFTVDDEDGAYIDDQGILTVSKAGVYKISTIALDENGEDLGFTINRIKLSVESNDWLQTILFDEPAMGDSELMLDDNDDVVLIGPLKNQLRYLDQNGMPWEGKKPEVSFSTNANNKSAYIRGGNFYASKPGNYTIEAKSDGFDIEPINVMITENPYLVIETEDPPIQEISSKNPEISIDLERYINYTTQFGGKWSGDEPELSFSLDSDVDNASIERKTVTDEETGEKSTYNAFVTSEPGEYAVHVTPKKASQYSKDIDDIIIIVDKPKEVGYLWLGILDLIIPEEDRVIMSLTGNGDPVSFKLSNYLTYYDTNDELIDIKKDNVILPEVSYRFYDHPEYNMLVPDESAAVINGDLFTAFKPGSYWIEALAADNQNVESTFTVITITDEMTAHNFGDWVITEAPTCEQDGTRIRKCQGHEDNPDCDFEIVDVIPATDHSWNSEFTADGKKYTKSGDDFEESEDGNYSGYEIRCMNEGCEEVRSKTYIEDGEEFTQTPATCTEPGLLSLSSGNSIEIEPTGHSWEADYTVDVQPTCESEGTESIHCKSCGAVREGTEKKIPMLKHDLFGDDVHVDPTCTEAGYDGAQCNSCKKQIVITTIPALGHDFRKKIVKATPDSDGTIANVCDRCQKEETIATIHKASEYELSQAEYTYNGKANKPGVTVKDDQGNVIDPLNYTVDYMNNTDAGKNATVTVTLGGELYSGKKSVTFTINKAANPLKIKAKTGKVKFRKLKKKNQTLSVKKVLKFTKTGQGKITYAKSSGNKKISINKKTGKVTVKKGLKKGTYKVKINVKAAGTSNYNAVNKTVTFKVKVK